MSAPHNPAELEDALKAAGWDGPIPLDEEFGRFLLWMISQTDLEHEHAATAT